MKKGIICSMILSVALLGGCANTATQESLNNSGNITTVALQQNPTENLTGTGTTMPTIAPTIIPTTDSNVTTLQTTIPTTADGVTTSQTIRATDTTASATRPTTMPMTTAKQYHTDSYEEYQKFIKNTKLPNWFVTYEQLAYMGSFDGLAFMSNTTKGEYDYYRYEIVSPAGFRIDVTIYSLDGDEPQYNLKGEDFSNVFFGDLRKIDTKQQGYIWKNNVLYTYVSGELLTATWVSGDCVFILSSCDRTSSMLASLPVEGQPAFISNLLHTDTVEAAMQSFKASMEAAAVK